MVTNDKKIRKLLAGITPQPFIWAEKGHVVILKTHVVEAGGDVDSVRAWVEQAGGHEDRTLPVISTRRGTTAVPKPVGKRYYVVPAAALSAD
ncbi:MAG: hypothetical protein ACR2LK_08935 [Solirubrobacteraceae bacterium]